MTWAKLQQHQKMVPRQGPFVRALHALTGLQYPEHQQALVLEQLKLTVEKARQQEQRIKFCLLCDAQCMWEHVVFECTWWWAKHLPEPDWFSTGRAAGPRGLWRGGESRGMSHCGRAVWGACGECRRPWELAGKRFGVCRGECRKPRGECRGECSRPWQLAAKRRPWQLIPNRTFLGSKAGLLWDACEVAGNPSVRVHRRMPWRGDPDVPSHQQKLRMNGPTGCHFFAVCKSAQRAPPSCPCPRGLVCVVAAGR